MESNYQRKLGNRSACLGRSCTSCNLRNKSQFIITQKSIIKTAVMSFSPVAVSEGGAKSLQSCDVSGELENPENTEDSENLGCLGDVLEGVL